MKNLSPFIQAFLEWPFSEFFSANVSLWNQCKYIAFNIFSWRISIISYKMLIIAGISNQKTNELTIYEKLCRSLLPTRTSFFISRELKACRSSKLTFLTSCFIADDSHGKNALLHAVVFSKLDFLHFRDNVHLFKYYPLRVPQNCFNSSNCSNQTCIQVSKFSFVVDK